MQKRFKITISALLLFILIITIFGTIVYAGSIGNSTFNSFYTLTGNSFIWWNSDDESFRYGAYCYTTEHDGSPTDYIDVEDIEAYCTVYVNGSYYGGYSQINYNDMFAGVDNSHVAYTPSSGDTLKIYGGYHVYDTEKGDLHLYNNTTDTY